jgi:YcxB-like protein
MGNSLVFELALDPGETVRAGQAIQERARARSNTFWLYWLIIPAAGVLTWRASVRTIMSLAIVVGIVLLVALVSPALRRRQVRRLYAGTPALAGAKRYEFNEEGLTLSNASASHLLRWSAFVQAAETPEFFLLYYSKGCAYYLPRRGIGSETQVDAVRQLLRDQLGERAIDVAPPT